MKIKILLASLLLVIILIVIYLLGREKLAQESISSSAGSAAVEVSAVQIGSIDKIITAVGTAAAMKDVMISSETAGRITKVFFDVGDIVTAGTVLVQVDDELKAIAVVQAEAQLLAAETNFKKSEKDYQRTEKLFETKDVSDAELEGYMLAKRAAEADWKSAAAGLKYAQRQLDDSKIKAPIDGTIASKMVEVGELLGPGRPIANIVDVNRLKVKISIPEEDIGFLTAGLNSEISADSDPGSAYTGKILSIGAKPENPMGHAYPVEIILNSRNLTRLKTGMFVRVTVSANVGKQTIIVPNEAVGGTGAEASVFIAENQVAHLRKVKTGLRGNSYTQILEGLDEKDSVITFGVESMTDGQKIFYK